VTAQLEVVVQLERKGVHCWREGIPSRGRGADPLPRAHGLGGQAQHHDPFSVVPPPTTTPAKSSHELLLPSLCSRIARAWVHWHTFVVFAGVPVPLAVLHWTAFHAVHSLMTDSRSTLQRVSSPGTNWNHLTLAGSSGTIVEDSDSSVAAEIWKTQQSR